MLSTHPPANQLFTNYQAQYDALVDAHNASDPNAYEELFDLYQTVRFSKPDTQEELEDKKQLLLALMHALNLRLEFVMATISEMLVEQAQLGMPPINAKLH